MEIDGLTEHRVVIKFLVKLGKTLVQIHEILSTVYGDKALKKTALFNWIKHLQEGRGIILKNAKTMQDQDVLQPLVTTKT
jgi:hypothetical protein